MFSFGRKKAIYEDPDALAEFTRQQEQLRKKKLDESLAQKKAKEDEEKQFAEEMAVLDAQDAIRKKYALDKKKFEEEELDRLIEQYSKKKPFKPFK